MLSTNRVIWITHLIVLAALLYVIECPIKNNHVWVKPKPTKYGKRPWDIQANTYYPQNKVWAHLWITSWISHFKVTQGYPYPWIKGPMNIPHSWKTWLYKLGPVSAFLFKHVVYFIGINNVDILEIISDM